MHSELERLRRENETFKARLGADPYEKREKLGEGGFCVVWRATKRVDDADLIEVCLKELKPELRHDPDSLRYFGREGSIASRLRHANIPGLIDIDQARYRLVYQLVDGVDARRLLAHAAGAGLAVAHAILIGLDVSSALDYAHNSTKKDEPAGIIHRDLTPANILISPAGDALLADFGVAAIQSSALQTSVRGTVAYMSPEQACGGAVDARTDLFSLGVVLYELIAGRRPFDGDGNGPASFERLRRCEYPELQTLAPHAPSALCTIIARLLQPSCDERYASASEVFSALAAIAPSLDAKRQLGGLSREARKRKTKEYDRACSQSDFGTARVPSQLLSLVEHDPAVHEQTTVVRRPANDEPPATVVTRKGTSRRAKNWWAAALIPMLIGAVFMVSRAGSTQPAREVVRAEAGAAPTEKATPPTLVAIDRSRLTEPERSALEPSSGDATVTAPPPPPTESAPPAASQGTPTGGASTSAPEQPLEGAQAEPAPAQATLRVSADKSAPVHIDGRLAGWSPLRVTVAPGAHTIVIGKAGPAQKTIRAEIEPGVTKNIFVNLRRPKTTD